jgi:MFS family permease
MMFVGTLRRVAANESMRRVQLGWLLAQAADGAYLVSLLVYAYAQGGVLAAGLVTTFRSLPSGFLAPVLSSFADRFPKARVLLAVHVMRGLTVAVVAASAFAGVPITLVLMAVVVEGLMIGLNRATTLSLMPALARSPEELVAGNATITLGEGIGALVGPVVAGALLMVGGPELGLSASAASFGLAAVAVLSLEVVAVRRTAPTVAPSGSRRLLDMLAGFGALRRYPSAGLVVGLFGSQTIVRGALTVLIVASAVELLGIGESGVGYLTSAIGGGGLIGATLAMTIVTGGRLALPFAIALAMWSLPIALLGFVPHPAFAFALLGVVGAANASLDVAGFTLLQRCVPNAVRARVFGALESVAALGMTIGAAAVPLLVQLVGLPAALVATGLFLPVLAITTFPILRRADAAAVVPHRELAVLRRIPMFAPLPLTVMEHLAGSLERVRYEKGTAVLTQGDAGDCFYVVASGAVDVVHDGTHVKTLAEGDGFGEIALLSERPRTASVIAREPVEAFRLPRPAFLEAVSGSSDSVVAADELMTRRLAELGHH